MKKILLCSLFFLCALITVFSPYLAEFSMSTQTKASPVATTSETNLLSTAIIKPMGVGGQTGSETIESEVYVKDKNGNDKRAFYLDELGIIVDENKNPIVSDGTIMNTYNEFTKEVVDGANRAMIIWLDSVSNKHYIKSSGKSYNKSINTSEEIFLINYRGTMIYSTRKERKRDWYEYVPIVNIFTSLREKYVWYDMNGRELVSDDIEEVKDSWWGKTGEVMQAYLTLGISEYWSVLDYTSIKDKLTLAELDTLLTHATENPWDGLTDQNNLPVVTTDGYRVRVNPRTNQLYSGGGLVYPIYNSVSGLPIIFANNDIITTHGQQQTIENAVLLQSITVQSLLNTNTDFYMDTVTTQYGTFDCPVFVKAETKERTLITGQSASGVTNGFNLWYESPTMGQDFSEWWNATFGDFGNGLSSFLNILKIIGVVIIVLLLLPLIVPLIKLISLPFVMLGNSLKNLSNSKKKGGRRYD
jgi:hypothetical protein